MDIASEWERCEPWIVDALAYGGDTHSLEQVQAAVVTGKAHFWPGARSAVITEFINWPQVKELNIWLAGGELSELCEMETAIRAFAVENGCKRLRAEARFGFAKMAKRHGWRPATQVFLKEIG